MRCEQHLRSLTDQVLYGRNRSSDTSVVSDGGALERYVQVTSHKHSEWEGRVGIEVVCEREG